MNKTITFDTLSRTAKELSAQIIMESADLVFVLGQDGLIQQVWGEDGTHLRDRPALDLADPRDHKVLKSLISAAWNGQRPSAKSVRHSDLLGQGRISRFTAHLTADSENVMLIGNSLLPESNLAKKAVDAEIALYQSDGRRASEIRYQTLFSASSEGLLIVSESGEIEDANFNASRLLGVEQDELAGSLLNEHFTDSDFETLANPGGSDEDRIDTLGVFATARESGAKLHAHCQTVRSFDRKVLMVRLNAVEAETNDEVSHSTGPLELLRKTSVPVLLTDPLGNGCWANSAFAALMPGQSVIGEHISVLLGVSTLAIERALREADEHGRVLTSLSALEGSLEVVDDAHVWLVGIPSGEARGFGLVIRFAEAKARTPIADPPQDHGAIAKLIGKAPMKALVRRSTEVLERNCIEAALKLSGSNRAAAAAVLGISRQSLYLKMRQNNLI